jgi:hypothetical protein
VAFTSSLSGLLQRAPSFQRRSCQLILRLSCSVVKGNLNVEGGRKAAMKPLNSLLQNQNLRVRALSSKAVSLLGKFPLGEVVRDCGRNKKNGPLPRVDP